MHDPTWDLRQCRHGCVQGSPAQMQAPCLADAVLSVLEQQHSVWTSHEFQHSVVGTQMFFHDNR